MVVELLIRQVKPFTVNDPTTIFTIAITLLMQPNDELDMIKPLESLDAASFLERILQLDTTPRTLAQTLQAVYSFSSSYLPFLHPVSVESLGNSYRRGI